MFVLQHRVKHFSREGNKLGSILVEEAIASCPSSWASEIQGALTRPSLKAPALAFILSHGKLTNGDGIVLNPRRSRQRGPLPRTGAPAALSDGRLMNERGVSESTTGGA